VGISKREKFMNFKKNSKKKKNIIYAYRGINEFRNVYQPRNNSVKDENGDLFGESHNTLNR
jgi:hypothetical protein